MVTGDAYNGAARPSKRVPTSELIEVAYRPGLMGDNR
jgi:hypothetical protein